MVEFHSTSLFGGSVACGGLFDRSATSPDGTDVCAVLPPARMAVELPAAVFSKVWHRAKMGGICVGVATVCANTLSLSIGLQISEVEVDVVIKVVAANVRRVIKFDDVRAYWHIVI